MRRVYTSSLLRNSSWGQDTFYLLFGTKYEKYQSISTNLEGEELSGIDVSRNAFAENKLRNGLIKTVNMGVIHLLILVVLHSDDIEDRYLV